MKRVSRSVIEVSAPTAQTSEELYEAARDALSIYGGASTSIHRDADLNVTISFDPLTATGGFAGVFAWLDSLDVEYEARVHRWFDEIDA